MIMKKTGLFSSLLGLSFLAVACGSSSGSNESASDGSGSAPQTQGTPDGLSGSKIGGSVVGPCSLEGDIRSFEINCTKTIKSFTFLFFTTGKKLTMTSMVNGEKHDLNIENQGTKLVGSEKLVSKIDLTINFADSTTGSASLWVAD